MRVRTSVLALTLSLAACAPPYESSAPAGNAQPAATTAAAAATAPRIDPLPPVAPGDVDALKAALAERLKGVPIDAVRATPVAGLYEVQSGMNIGYVSADGRYLIEGDLNDLGTGARLTEARRQQARVALMSAIGPDKTIDFTPAGAPAKYTVTVFTDIDCGYCRKLHQHIAEYNADGIAVRYVFFPRSGPNTESFRKAEQVWCAADRKAALTQAKLGAPLEGDSGCANPVMDHLRIAAQLGLRGTPAILLPDGELIPGYQTPDQLLGILSQHAAANAGGQG